MVGGFLVASIQKLLTYVLMSVFGVWMGSYEGLLPIVFLFLVLAVEPNGLSAIKIGTVSAASLRGALRRLGRSLWNLLKTE
jgi:branched-subunit amino acid ABC-type transport system permease component